MNGGYGDLVGVVSGTLTATIEKSQLVAIVTFDHFRYQKDIESVMNLMMPTAPCKNGCARGDQACDRADHGESEAFRRFHEQSRPTCGYTRRRISCNRAVLCIQNTENVLKHTL